MRLEKNEGGEVDLPASIEWIVEDDPPGQSKLTNPNTGQVYNVKEDIPTVLALLSKERGQTQ